MRRAMLLLPLLSAGAPSDGATVRYRVEVDASVTWVRAGQVRRDSITLRAVVSIALADSAAATWARFTVNSASFRQWTIGMARPPIAWDPSTGRSFLRRIEPGKHPTVVWTGERIPWSPALTYLVQLPEDCFPPIGPSVNVGSRWVDTLQDRSGRFLTAWFVPREEDGERVVQGRERSRVQAGAVVGDGRVSISRAGLIDARIPRQGPIRYATIHRATTEQVVEGPSTTDISTTTVTRIVRQP